MTSTPETSRTEAFRHPEEWRFSRDRVLLYVRALDLPPYQGLDFAIESLKSSPSASPAKAMRNLRKLLAEHDLDRGLLDEEGKHIASVPPLIRGVMVAKPLDRVPWKTTLVRFVQRWKRNLFGPEEELRHE